ncbi:MAG: helix-turn-helix transcriptional regulator [Pseudomonadota bacterium]
MLDLQTTWEDTLPAVAYVDHRAPLHDALAAMLDEVDYPMLLVDAACRLRHANRMAHGLLADGTSLRIEGQHLLLPKAQEAPLAKAVQAACHKGLRSLVQLDLRQDLSTSVAVSPLAWGDDPPLALLVFCRPAVCQDLSLQGFARAHGLTLTETKVLQALCEGVPVRSIARQHGVALSTVRTQVGNLRAKLGAGDIRALVQRVATLPPMLHALRALAPRC